MKVKIKDIGKVVTGKTPSTSNSANFGEGYLFITPVDLHVDSGVIEHSQRNITKEGFKSIKSNTISGLSILVGCIGWDMGNVALVNQKCATNQQINAITDINNNICNPYYIYYWLKIQKDYLFKIANVTRTPILKKSDFENIEINLPNKKIQDSVAKFCRNIDLKINTNNAISKELESMAKTIYDYWFLQFEFPDKDGKPYKSNGGKMVWNDQLKQEIPEGWQVDNLYKIADFINGIACQKYRPLDNKHKLPVIKITEMHDGFTSKTEFVRDSISEDHIIKNGDILFSWSASLETMIWNYGKGGLNQHIFKVIPKNGFSLHYVYQTLSSYIINFKRMAEARKTTMGHITQDHLKQSEIMIPPQNLINKFENVVRSFYDEITMVDEESQELKSLRDFLLPLLMNGQVTIED